MLQTSFVLMKGLNKTETPIFLPVVCSLFPKAFFFFDVYFSSGRSALYGMSFYDKIAMLCFKCSAALTI